VSLELEHAACCLCGEFRGEPIAVGEDFEYRTSPDTFLAMRCPNCDLVYLDPRPSTTQMSVIYPDDYHAFSFDEDRYGVVFRMRRRIELRRLLSICDRLDVAARILDVGCGDGFHLSLLASVPGNAWRLEGVDPDSRAVEAARLRGVNVHHGTVEDLSLPAGAYDAALMIQTVEHVDDPVAVVSSVRRLLRPGGRLLIVTDNTDSLDFRLFGGRHWGGYHFPRHWNLFNRRSLDVLTRRAGMELQTISTMVSPVNWVYSIRNLLDDWGAPARVVRHFSLDTPAALSAFTAFDAIHASVGRGALLRAVLRRPDCDRP
jgi:SAM-dependent methyltransferase